jgi:hypothetical protein
VRILKIIGWVVLVFVVGLAGTVAIFVTANSIVDTQTRVRLPSGPIVATDYWDRGYVYAEGTFTIDNDRSAFPIQTSKISCYRDRKSCTRAQAEIAFRDMLNVELTEHDVSLWNETTILFLEDPLCVRYVYTIDRTNKRVFGSRTKKPNVAGCELVDAKPLTLSLVNGFDVWWRLNQEAFARVSPFMWAGIAAWWIALLIFAWSRRPRAPAKMTTAS